MAKSNPKKHVQLLSPENYIRQKSRNLPIYECRINSDWKEGQLASIILSRVHSNGNISFSIYLVDLGCLGVKDSLYYFNMPSDEYQDYIEKFEDKLPSETISYELAHNIVYAGIQFAEEYGFKPCKEFTSVTKYMLEEDTDGIELIEIEVGAEDGNPLYINNGYETPTKVNQILKQLEKTAGVGNFTFIDNVAGFEDEEWEEELAEMTLQELKDQFGELNSKGIENLTKDEIVKFNEISDEIYVHLSSGEKVDEYFDSWQNELDLELDVNYNNEFIGVDTNFVITDKLLKIIDETILQIDKKPEKADKKIAELEKLIGKTHFIAFLRLEVIKQLSLEEYTKQLKEYTAEFPDCSMLKLIVVLEKCFSNESETTVPTFESIFENRRSITLFEMYRYWNDKLIMIASQDDINQLEAFYLFLDEININEELIDLLKSTTSLMRILFLEKYLSNE